jgi:hypothetical protein
VDALGYTWAPDEKLWRQAILEYHRGGVRTSYEEMHPDQRAARGLPTPRVWDVSNQEGEQVARVLLPQGFSIKAVGEDFIVGAWADEDGKEYVRVYSLDRGG